MANSEIERDRDPHASSRQDRVDGCEALYRQYHDDVLRLCRRIAGDAHLAEDLTQETFVRAMRAWATIDPSRDPWPWLSRVARNLCVDTLRAGRHWMVEREPSSESDMDTTFEAVSARFEQRQLRRRLTKALESLTPQQRRVVMLRLVNELSCEEVAKAEGTRVKTIKNVTWQARQRLRLAWSNTEGPLLGWIVLVFDWVRERFRRCKARLTSGLLDPIAAESGRLAVSLYASAAVITLVVFGVTAGAITGQAAAGPRASARAISVPARPVEDPPAPAGQSAATATVGDRTLRFDPESGTASATFHSDPQRPGKVAPPAGYLEVELDGPNGQPLLRSGTWWSCNQFAPNAVLPSVRVKTIC
jgi:RNA polymerase sigma-70 factor (ECF subfamily)